MNDTTSRYKCPACQRAILNRKIDKCLYCGAILPADLLLPAEAIAELNRQQRQLEEQARTKSSQPAADNTSSTWALGDVVDVIDIAADVASGIANLLD